MDETKSPDKGEQEECFWGVVFDEKHSSSGFIRAGGSQIGSHRC